MKSPFQFGRVVVGDAFTNRTDDIKRLKANIQNNVHTVLISPRRWGKSSLVKQTALKFAENKKIRFCFIDLFKIRNEEDFYSTYANAVIKSTSTRTEEWVKIARSFLGRITPRISLGADHAGDVEITFDLERLNENYEEILDLPEKIAEQKKIDIIVCLDEFQNLGNFNEPVLYQKRLRAIWQYHQQVTYILYGSKRHMLMNLFENKSMPFYKFGDVIYLDKIAAKHLKKFIMDSFSRTGKEIGDNHAGKIIEYVKCHPYYTQQLAHLTWINTEDRVTGDILDDAVRELLGQNSLLYQKEIEALTTPQINFLTAVVDGFDQLSSQEVIRKYNLNSSANVSRLKKALEKKEVVDTLHGKTEIIDPVFELWFKEYYEKR
jgi:hypothetical protein